MSGGLLAYASSSEFSIHIRNLPQVTTAHAKKPPQLPGGGYPHGDTLTGLMVYSEITEDGVAAKDGTHDVDS